jgi:hypothetical protein
MIELFSTLTFASLFASASAWAFSPTLALARLHTTARTTMTSNYLLYHRVMPVQFPSCECDDEARSDKCKYVIKSLHSNIYTMNFREFLLQFEIKLKPFTYKPDAKIPMPLFRNSGPENMNPFKTAHLPSKPYMPIFRMGKGQAKTNIVNRKH